MVVNYDGSIKREYRYVVAHWLRCSREPHISRIGIHHLISAIMAAI